MYWVNEAGKFDTEYAGQDETFNTLVVFPMLLQDICLSFSQAFPWKIKEWENEEKDIY